MPEPPRRTVVVGGGLAGLTAARDLAATGREVIVLEGSPRVGGKLLTSEVAGVAVDLGAEAMLARRPEGVDLAREARAGRRPPGDHLVVGLDQGRAAAAAAVGDGRARRRRAGRRRPACSATRASTGCATRPAADPLADGEDVSVGELVATRLGDEVVDRLVEPLLGGVYAGHARQLSARATVPQLVAWSGESSLVEAAAAGADGVVRARSSRASAGGLGRLPVALADGLDVRTGAPVRELRRTPTGFALVVGPTTAAEEVLADEVVLATPAAPTARLLAERRAGRRGRAGGRRVRLDGHRHPGLPRRRRPRPAGLRLPRTSRRRPHHQGLDLLLRQVGLGPRGRRRAPAPAHLGRPAPRGARAPGPRRGARRRVARRPRRRHRPGGAARSTPTCSAGAAACRSTPSATSTGSPGSVPTWRGCPGWRSAGRRTTAWASPPSSPRPAGRWPRLTQAE